MTKNLEKDKLNNASSSMAIPGINGSALTSLIHKGIGFQRSDLMEYFNLPMMITDFCKRENPERINAITMI